MDSILIRDLAAEENLHSQTVRTYIRRLGIRVHYRRDPRRGNQKCAAVTQAQIDQFRQWREAEGFTGNPIFPWEREA